MRALSIFGRKEDESLVKAVYREIGYEIDPKNPDRHLVMIPKAVSRAVNYWKQELTYYDADTEERVDVDVDTNDVCPFEFNSRDREYTNEFYLYKCWGSDDFINRRFWEKYPYPKNNNEVDATNEYAEIPRQWLEDLYGHYLEMKKFFYNSDKDGFNDYVFKHLVDSHKDFNDRNFGFEWDSFEENIRSLKILLDGYKQFYINTWD